MDRGQALLNDVIEKGLQGTMDLTPGSDEYIKATEAVSKLYELKIKEDEADSKFAETEVKREQLKEAKIDRIVNIGTKVLEIGAPMVFYSFWMGNVMSFEETGRFTSTVFRTLFGRFKLPGQK